MTALQFGAGDTAQVAIEHCDRAGRTVIDVYRVRAGGNPTILGKELISMCLNQKMTDHWLRHKYGIGQPGDTSCYHDRQRLKFTSDYTYVMIGGRWFCHVTTAGDGTPYLMDLYSLLQGINAPQVAYYQTNKKNK